MNHRDGKYWCCDGQHRIYALRQNGFAATDVVECEVYENLTDEEMAEIFLGRDDRRAIAPFVKFHLACTAGHVAECAIRRVVEANGVAIKRAREDGAVSAVSTLVRIYHQSVKRDVAVGWVVRVAKVAFGGDPLGFDAVILDGLGLVYNRYDGRTNEKDLIERLRARTGGARGLIQRAEELRHRTGSAKGQCVASEIVEIYNKGVATRANRLAPWWKQAPAA